MLQCCYCVTLCKLYRHVLYVCIILETAHHRTTFGIICNFTQKTIHEENSCKMFHISSLIALFLMGRSRMFFFLEIRMKFHLVRTKGRGKRGVWGEKPNMVFFFFFAKFHYLARCKLYLTNCSSDELLITTIVISMPKNQSAKTFK